MKKKVLCVLLSCAVLLAVPAHAAFAVQTQQADAPSMEEKAQMLRHLGLFRGSEKGFELDRTMRRDEAAAMLVRFLGEEKAALAGTFETPFTDVPEWARPYVGWLYKSGLTNGVSHDSFGADETVTYDQYCVLLSRAAGYGGTYEIAQEILPEDVNLEEKLGAPLLRGEAVDLSVRALSAHHQASWETLAQILLRKGAVSEQALITYAAPVCGMEYSGEFIGDDMYIQASVAGAAVMRSENKYDGVIDYGSVARPYIIAERGGQCYVLDAEKLEETPIEATAGRHYTYAAEYGKETWLFCEEDDGQYSIAVFDGAQMRAAAPTFRFDDTYGSFPYRNYNYTVSDARMLIMTETEILRIDLASGAHEQVAPKGDVTFFAYPGTDTALVASLEGGTLTLQSYRGTAPVKDGRIVLDVGALIEELNASGEIFQPYMLSEHSETSGGLVRFSGRCGVFEYEPESGAIKRIFERSSPFVTAIGGQVYILTRTAEGIPVPQDAPSNVGDEIGVLKADGTYTVLLAGTPKHGIWIDSIDGADGDTVYFSQTSSAGMAKTITYRYAVKDGRITVTAFDATDGDFLYTQEEITRRIGEEQARIDAIYDAQ